MPERTDALVTGQTGTRIAQVALSALDAQRSAEWYQVGLGYLPAGERHPTAPLSAVQGVPDAQVDKVVWLVDRQAGFQLEIFQYSQPPVRPQRADRTHRDIGWTSVGVWVADFDATVQRLRKLNVGPVHNPTGPVGHRRGSALDPDGVLIELLEADPAPPTSAVSAGRNCSVVTRNVRASVPDLDRSLDYFCAAIGLVSTDQTPNVDELHPEPATGVTRSALLAGGDIWLELVEHVDPPGRPRLPDYRISDQGLLNIAIGERTLDGYQALRNRVSAAGFRLHQEIVRERLRIQYVEDADGFSVELGYYDPALDPEQGFEPIDASPMQSRSSS